MKTHNIKLLTTGIFSMIAGLALISTSSSHAREASKDEPGGILQVFTPSKKVWDPHMEMLTHSHHDVEILAGNGERIRSWWHRRAIRLQPGDYTMRVPALGGHTFPVSIQEGNSKQLHIRANGEASLKIINPANCSDTSCH